MAPTISYTLASQHHGGAMKRQQNGGSEISVGEAAQCILITNLSGEKFNALIALDQVSLIVERAKES